MKIKKFKYILLLIFVVLTFSGCKKQNDFENIEYDYDEEKKILTIQTDSTSNYWVTFNVVLLNKSKEIIFLEQYNNKFLSKGYNINIPILDVKPEYIKEEKIKNVELEDILVCEIDKNNVNCIISFSFVCILILIKILLK